MNDADVERVCRAMIAVSRPQADPDALTPLPRGRIGLMPMWQTYTNLATAAIAAMQACAQPPEIRRTTDGTLDEIVAGACSFHLEQMANNAWWMGIVQGGKLVNVWLRSKGKITAYVEETPEKPPAPGDQGEG